MLIFSDSSAAILYLQGRFHGSGKKSFLHLSESFAEQALDPLEELLRLNCKVEINWVPSHVGVEGNTRADYLAAFGSAYAHKNLESEDLPSGVRLGIFPYPDVTTTSGSKFIHPSHISYPLIDSIHWRREEVQDRLKQELNDKLKRSRYHAFADVRMYISEKMKRTQANVRQDPAPSGGMLLLTEA